MSKSMSTPRRSVVPPTSTHESYHPGGYGVSEGLKRARRPFLVKNALTGGVIMGFAVGVYWYSISKVRQDDFSDLADVRAVGAGAPPSNLPPPSPLAASSSSQNTIISSSQTSDGSKKLV